MRISVIANGAASQAGDVFREQVSRLRDDGHDVAVHLTFEGGDAERFSRLAAAESADVIIAGGGDGTVNEVANGIASHIEAAAGEPPRLAILPLGTGNDLATALGLSEAPSEAFDIAVAGVAHPLDVGIANGRYFLNVSTGGFGAEATEETSPDAKRALGAIAYLATGARKFVNLELTAARFVADGEALHEGEFFLFAVGNSKRTGGGNWLTPRADPADGLLDVCIVKEMPRLDFVRLLPDLRTGQHVGHASVIYRQVERVRIESASQLSVNVDGEPLPPSEHFDFSLAAWRLPTMLPRPAQ